jgi:DNA primase
MNEPKLRALLDEVGVVPTHKNRRGWIVAACPFAEYLHEYGTDTNPSFFVKVSPDGYSGYNCFTCHQHGNLSRFLEKLGALRGKDYNGLMIRAMLEETPENFQPWDEGRDEAYGEAEEVPTIECQTWFKLFPPAMEFKRARKYLAKRGISEETAEIINLRYDDDEERILFPVMDSQGRLFGFTGRSILRKDEFPSKKYSKVKDYAGLKKEKLILGENLIVQGRPILVVEGLFAFAHMIEIGVDSFCNVVATMGSHMSVSQRNIIVEYDEPVFMLYDNDAAGEQGLFGPCDSKGYHEGGGAVDLLKPHVPTHRVIYPDGVDDPDNLRYEDVFGAVMNGKHEAF